MKKLKKRVKTILSDVDEFDVYQEVDEYDIDGRLISKIEYSNEGELMSEQKNKYQDGKLVYTKISHPLIFSEEDISYKRNENGLLMETVFNVNEEVDMIKRREYAEDNSLEKELWIDSDENILRTIEFDAKGRVSKEISPEGYETEYDYNKLGYLSGVRIYEGDDLKVEQKNEYSENGNQIKSHGVSLDSNQEVVVEKYYNEGNLLSEEIQYVDGYHEITKNYSYDSDDQLAHASESSISPSGEAHVIMEYRIEYKYH